MRYKVKVPPTAEQGSYTTTARSSYMQSYRAAALQDYNSCRAHDGLEPVRRMPVGTVYEKLCSLITEIVSIAQTATHSEDGQPEWTCIVQVDDGTTRRVERVMQWNKPELWHLQEMFDERPRLFRVEGAK